MLKIIKDYLAGFALFMSLIATLVSALVWFGTTASEGGAHRERDKQLEARVQSLEQKVGNLSKPEPDVARQECARLAQELQTLDSSSLIGEERIQNAMNGLGCHRAF